MDSIAVLLHLVVFIIWAVGVYVDEYLVRPPYEYLGYDFDFRHYGGRLKYLTVLNSLLQCGYFGLCVLNDVGGTETQIRKKQGSLQKFRDWLFTTLVFPMGLFVSLIFWTLYSIDRELIFPELFDSWFPCWLNHVMHTLPIVGVLMELWNVCHCFQNGASRFGPIITVYVLYLSWIFYIAYASGRWVYPIFEVLDVTGKALFFGSLLFLNLFLVNIGGTLHNKFWGKGHKTKEDKKAE